MVKRYPSNSGTLVDAVEIGAMLRPWIEAGVNRLASSQRLALKDHVLAAERILADRKLADSDRLTSVFAEMEKIAKLGPTWRTVAEKMRDFPDSSTHVLSMILGIILESISAAESGRRAA